METVENILKGNNGQVVKILSKTKLVINRGSNHNVTLGDKYLIYGLTEELFDPETKESLGSAEVIRGKGIVIHLQETLCTIESTTIIQSEPHKKIIKQHTDILGSQLSSFLQNRRPEIIEEITPGGSYIMEFTSPQKGDYARKI